MLKRRQQLCVVDRRVFGPLRKTKRRAEAGEHRMSDWVSNEEVNVRSCLDCDYEEKASQEKPISLTVWIAIGWLGMVAAGAAISHVAKKKKA